MLCPGAGVGVQSRYPSLLSIAARAIHPSQFFGFKGRRHLLSRNDFNQQRLENPRIATLSQQLFSNAGNGKCGWRISWFSAPPHHAVSAGGGWLAISRPQTEPQYDTVS